MDTTKPLSSRLDRVSNVKHALINCGAVRARLRPVIPVQAWVAFAVCAVSLAQAQPISFKEGGSWTVWHAKSSSPLNSITDADALFDGQNQASATVTTNPYIEFFDSGGAGNYNVNRPFPGVSGDDFAIRVTGTIYLFEAGAVTFGFNTDDGGRLRVDGQTVAEHPQTRAPANSLGSIALERGYHDLEFQMFERGGGAGAELFVAKEFGELTTYEPSQFRLLPASPPRPKPSLVEKGGRWRVQAARTAEAVSSAAEAQALLASADPSSQSMSTHRVINFSGPAETGLFTAGEPLPLQPGEPESFAILATGRVSLEEAGRVTFGFQANRGGRLSVDGQVVAQTAEGPAQWNSIVAQDQPEIWWRFNQSDTENSIANHGARTGHVGTANGVVLGTPGVFGPAEASEFTGADGNYVSSSDVERMTGPASYEYILFGRDLGVAQALHTEDSAANNTSLRFEQWDNTGQLGFTEFRVADYFLTPVEGGRVASPFNQWSHLVFVRNPAGPELVSVYLNGRLAGVSNIDIPFPTALLGATSIGGDAFSGLIDESVIYGRALTPSRIAAHFNAFEQARPGGTLLAALDLAVGAHEVEFLVWGTEDSASTELFVARQFGDLSSFDLGEFELLEAGVQDLEPGLTLEVTTTDPAGEGSLRDALEVLQDQPDDGQLHTIDLTSIEGTISLEAPLPWINRNVLLRGPGPEHLAISGSSAHQVMFIEQGQVEIRGLTIRDGLAKGSDVGGGGGGGGGMGGGLFVNEGASVQIVDVTFANNAAQGGSGGSGGAAGGGSAFAAMPGSNGAAGAPGANVGANGSGLRDGVNGKHGGKGDDGKPGEDGENGLALGSGGGAGGAGGGGRSGGNGAKGRNARSVTGFLGYHDYFEKAGDGGNGGNAGNGGQPGNGGHGEFGGGGGSGGQGGQAGTRGGSPGGGGSEASGLIFTLGGPPAVARTPAGDSGRPGAGGTTTNGGRGGDGGYGGGAGGGGLGFPDKGSSHGPDGVSVAYGGFAANISGGGGGAGLGGAIFVRAHGSLSLRDARFEGNIAQGGSGGGEAGPGQGKGGALFAMDGAVVTLETGPDLLDNLANSSAGTEGDNDHFYNVDFPAPGFAGYTFHQDVREQMYYSEGDGAEARNSAGLRYLHLLYRQFPDGPRAQFELMDPDSPNPAAQLYSQPERARIEQAFATVERALALDPENAAWRKLWLDIHYDRAAAEAILAKQLLAGAARIRFNPPAAGEQTGENLVDGRSEFVIHEEIRTHEAALAQNRVAFDGLFALLGKNAGLSLQPPLGYQVLQNLTPARSLLPAAYLDTDGNPQPVSNGGAPLFSGYKDVVLLFDLLRAHGRTAIGLSELYLRRNQSADADTGAPGDRDRAITLIGDTQQFMLLHRDILLQGFPNLPMDEGDPSGVHEMLAGVNQALADLATLHQAIEGGQSPLGFKRDFLMLVSNRASSFDSFDNLQTELNPAETTNPLGWALATWGQAQASIDTAGRLEDDLKFEFQRTTTMARNRLFDVIGARPGDPGYTTPERNVGSEIWQQLQSIEAAKLRVQRNRVEIDNLDKKVRIEIDRRGQELGINNAISQVKVRYINQRADLTEKIGRVQAAQKTIDNFAEIFTFEKLTKGLAVVGILNGLAQGGLELHKTQLETQKERLAADEQMEITALENDLITANSEAQIKTWLLEMDTLLLDSQEAAILLVQELGRLTALYDEQAELERRLAEANVDLGSRYFADPVHRLRESSDSLQANLAFQDAQKWLFFMARALEYKWNVRFRYPSPADPQWTLETLYQLRNASELQLFYNALSNFDRELGQPQNKGSFRTWFSLREDFFGLHETNPQTGQVLTYVDPANPGLGATLTAKEAFRQELAARMVDLLKPENTAVDFDNPQVNPFVDLELEFNTVRQKDNFFVGPVLRLVGNATVPVAGKEGAFLDKIQRMRIRIPGSHSTGAAQVAGNLSYGGTSFIRNWDAGSIADPNRPDEIRDEMTAYSTRFWFRHPDGDWRFTEAMNQRVTLELTGPNPGQSAPPPDSILDFDTFKERSVAATGWKLNIELISNGVVKLRLDEIDDIELFFFHEAYTRQSQ